MTEVSLAAAIAWFAADEAIQAGHSEALALEIPRWAIWGALLCLVPQKPRIRTGLVGPTKSRAFP